MAFLSGLMKIALDWAFNKLTEWIGGLVRFYQRKAQVEKEAEESVKPIKDAQTEKEIDDAARDLLGKL